MEEVAVVGVANPILGQSSCACIVRRSNDVQQQTILDCLRGQVADYKIPDHVLFVDRLPKLVGGIKIKKFGAGSVTEMAQRLVAGKKS